MNVDPFWSLWTARNNLIFNNKQSSTEDTVSKAVFSASARDVVRQTDAAWNGNLIIAGMGWIIKKAEEKLSFQSSSNFVSSPLVAEGLAMREASKMQRTGAPDSSQLVKALNSKVEPPELNGIVGRIECIAFESFSFVWIPRRQNSDADTLAKWALNLVTVIQTA